MPPQKDDILSTMSELYTSWTSSSGRRIQTPVRFHMMQATFKVHRMECSFHVLIYDVYTRTHANKSFGDGFKGNASIRLP